MNVEQIRALIRMTVNQGGKRQDRFRRYETVKPILLHICDPGIEQDVTRMLVQHLKL